MKLEQSFEVDAPLERVWEALVDVERVAPCLPGAAVTGRNEDGSYDGTFSVKIGPTSASYAGKLEMEQIDEGVHTATMQASGTDKRGQGGAKATIVSSLAPTGSGGTRVDVSTDYHITGRLARFGRGGMIEDISNKLLREFAKNLQSSLAGDGESPVPASGSAASQAPSETGATATSERPEAAAASVETGGSEPAGGGGDEPSDASGVSGGAYSGEPEAASGEGATLTTATGGTGPEASSPAPAATPGESGPQVGWTPPPPSSGSEPMQGLSLVGTAVWGQVKRNPAPAAGVLVALLILLRLVRR